MNLPPLFSWTTLLTFAAEEAPQQPGLAPMLMPMILIAVVFYFLMIRPQRREQQKREEVLNALKKNDRVVTIGGIIGTIANISSDGKEVTVKVDDNVKIRFQRSAIHAVQRDDDTSDAAKASAEKPA